MSLLLRILKFFYKQRSFYFSNNWKRSLPFGDYVSDRWEKARALGFGKGSSVYDNVIVLGEVKVGQNTWIGPNVVLDGSNGLEIGDNCSISAGVQIYSHDTVEWAISGGQEDYKEGRTTIGSNCYIGPNSVISCGVHIGKGSIVGSNSFVSKSIKSGSKVAGNPAKEIERNRSDI